MCSSAVKKLLTHSLTPETVRSMAAVHLTFKSVYENFGSPTDCRRPVGCVMVAVLPVCENLIEKFWTTKNCLGSTFSH